MDELLIRALRAYGIASRKSDTVQTEPSATLSDVEEHSESKYVVLRNVNGILAVYKLKPSGTLRAMKRWPKTISA
jgi:hypothetical protein